MSVTDLLKKVCGFRLYDRRNRDVSACIRGVRNVVAVEMGKYNVYSWYQWFSGIGFKQMDVQEFIEYCRKELITSFVNIKHGKPNDKQKHRTEGLLQAIRMLGLMELSELNRIIEEEHYNVFGETVEARKERKQSLAELKEVSPDDYFSIPAIERR